jgi:AraC-like DNA-binding protein
MGSGAATRTTAKLRVASTLAGRLEELGVAPGDVLRHADLPPRLLDQDRIVVSTDELFALYRAIGEVGPDPTVGLQLGAEQRIERYDPVAIAAISARSLRDALQKVARYKQLTCPQAIDLIEKGGDVRVQFRWLLARDTVPPVLIDMCLAWTAALARRGSGGAIRPRRVELGGSRRQRAVYKAHFECPVKFDAAQDRIAFAASDVDRPFVTHNADLLASIAPHLESELTQSRAQQSVGEHVKSTLKRLIAGSRPAIDEVARELGVSTRTLQRRLTDDGLTFQRLTQEARHELARHYLLNSSVDLNETAYLLGYEHAHSFLRAFHQWEGSSPGAWRSRRGKPRSRPT